MADVQFVEGLRVYPPHENAPEFVKAALVIEPEELRRWLGNGTDKVRIDVKVGRSGSWYCAVNTFKPKPQGEQQSARNVEPDFDDSSIPF